MFGAMKVTTPERTALDLACWYPRDSAIAAIDALATFDAHTRTAHIGLPSPTTQIEVPMPRSDKFLYLDMGWEHLKVAVECDGKQHWTRRSQYSWDVRRHEILQRQGWIVIRVLASDTPADVLRRVREAIASRV